MGNIQSVIYCAGDLLKTAFKKHSLVALDVFMFSLCIPSVSFMVFSALLQLGLMIANPASLPTTLPIALLSLAGGYLVLSLIHISAANFGRRMAACFFM